VRKATYGVFSYRRTETRRCPWKVAAVASVRAYVGRTTSAEAGSKWLYLEEILAAYSKVYLVSGGGVLRLSFSTKPKREASAAALPPPTPRLVHRHVPLLSVIIAFPFWPRNALPAASGAHSGCFGRGPRGLIKPSPDRTSVPYATAPIE
jgi:hypothetical protein